MSLTAEEPGRSHRVELHICIRLQILTQNLYPLGYGFHLVLMCVLRSLYIASFPGEEAMTWKHRLTLCQLFLSPNSKLLLFLLDRLAVESVCFSLEGILLIQIFLHFIHIAASTDEIMGHSIQPFGQSFPFCSSSK